MIKQRQKIFVDTGAWIALAAPQDAMHTQAIRNWDDLMAAQANLVTSLHIQIETFTFLQRNAHHDVAMRWLDGLKSVPRLTFAEVKSGDVEAARVYFGRGLHKLSLADALSFVVMTREKIRHAFAFDHHFASAGFLLVG